MAMPPSGEKVRVPSLVSGFARLIRYRCNELGAFADDQGQDTRRRRADRPQGAEDRPRRHAELDRRCGQSQHGRRLRAVPEGAGHAGWAAPSVLDVALRRVSAGARWLVQGVEPRHAGMRSGVDRDEAAQAPELRRDQRVVPGPDSRFGQGANLAVDHRLSGAVDDSSLRDARHPDRGRLSGRPCRHPGGAGRPSRRTPGSSSRWPAGSARSAATRP